MHPLWKKSRSSHSGSTSIVDALERRCLLAASLAADGTLEVSGTDGPDAITIRLGAGTNHLHVQEGTTTLFVFLRDRVRSVSVQLGGGDDVLNLDTSPGLLAGAAGAMPIQFEGGDGADALRIFGAPAGGAGISEVLTVGPDAGSGILSSRETNGLTHSVQFAAVESFIDSSIAASLTILGNDGRNVVEVTSGSLVGGVTPTGAVRILDVSPVAAANVPASSAAAMPVSARQSKQQVKEAKREAKKLAKENKRLAKERQRAEKARKRSGAATQSDAPAQPITQAPVEQLRVDRTHVFIHFANKTAVSIDANAGDDRIAVNFTGVAPAGLSTLTLDGGAGTDRVIEQSNPPGVTVVRANLESTAATRDFVLTSDRPPLAQPPIPEPPPPLPSDGSIDEDRDDDSRDDSVDKDPDNDASRDDSIDEDRDADDNDDDDD